MNSPQIIGEPSSNIQELIDEIAFQHVLLSSIDDTVENRTDAEHDVRTEIKSLQMKLKQQRDMAKATMPKSTMATSQSSLQSRKSPWLTPSNFSPPSPFAALSVRPTDSVNSMAMNRVRGTDQATWRQPDLDSSAASTPNSAADSPQGMGNPPQGFSSSRKRSYDKHLDGGLAAPLGGNKSQRTSPSPYMTSPSTPAAESSGDDEFSACSELFINREREFEAKRQRELADADFARRLANNPQATYGQASLSKSSAFDRMSGIRPPASSVSSSMQSMQPPRTTNVPAYPPPSRKLPPTWNNTSSMKQESTSMSNGVKYEITNRNLFPSQSAASGSGSANISLLDDDSDSDIEVIPPSAFHDNGRSASTSVTGSNGALQSAMHGNSSVPFWRTARNGPSHSPAPYAQPAMGMHTNAGRYVNRNPSFVNDTPLHLGNPATNNGNLAYMPSALDARYPETGMQRSRHGVYWNSAEDKMDDILEVRGTLSPYSNIGSQFNLPGIDPTTGLPRNPYTEVMRDQIDYIMNDPRKTSDEIKSLLENIRPDLDLSIENRVGTPDGLKYPLYEHQKLALTWLISMETGTNKGSILADDMGLGKTISALALMLSRPSNDRSLKTTLIVGPVALVRQWEREIKTKIQAEHRLSTILLHGPGKKPGWDELRNFDVVLTTYGTLGAELRRKKKWIEDWEKKGIRDYDQAPMRKLFPLLGPSSNFYRIILDEAQCIKNKSTQGAQAAYNLQGQFRLCLTGTPMMNNAGELYSLIHFLRIRPYNDWTRFQNEFSKLSKGTHSDNAVQNSLRKLQAVLKAILLRRTKQSEIDGKPIITLPPKTEEIQHVVFSNDEHDFYKALENKTQMQFNKYLKAGTVGRNYSNILVLLLRLRQCCCHPHLITDFEQAPSNSESNAMIELAKGLSPDVIRRLLEMNAFECPVCYDGVENPRIVIPCGHDTCAECLSRIADQTVQQNMADGNEAGGAAKCPTCRGKVEMDKIIDYVTFKRVHMLENPAENTTVAGESDDGESDNSDSDVKFDSGSESDVNSDGDLRDFIIRDDVDDDELDNEHGSAENDTIKEAEILPDMSMAMDKTKGEKDKKGKTKAKKEKKILSLAMLKTEANKSAKGRRKYMKYLRANWVSSAKVDKCVELLERFKKDGQKTIIFSQFVALLDLLQVPIEKHGWNFQRYDGSMSSDARNNAITRFTDQPDCGVMLISLKAGNSGLNLVAASRVIVLDPFWNPFIEMQAVDRAYRIGQQKPVEVHRILIQSTVEDRIVELQEKKRKLVDAALDEGASKSLGRLDVAQLAFLFGVGNGN